MKSPIYAAICLLFFAPMAMQLDAQNAPNPVVGCDCFDADSISFPCATSTTTDPVNLPKSGNDGTSTVQIQIKLGANSDCPSDTEVYIAIKGYLKNDTTGTYLYGSDSAPEEVSINQTITTPGLSTDYEKYEVELFVLHEDGSYTPCSSKAFEFGCSACAGSCPAGSSGSSQGESVRHTIMMGSSSQGDVALPLVFYSTVVQNPGVSALTIQAGSGITINSGSNGHITSVITDTTEAIVSPVSRPNDPNAFKVELKHRSGGTTGSLIQTTVFESVGTGSDMVMRFSTTKEGMTEVVDFKKIVDATGEYYYWSTLTKHNGLIRETIKKKVSSDSSARIVRTIEEYLKADGTTYEIVSDVEETYASQAQGERVIKQVIDPDGAALTSTWEYWGAGEDTSASANGSTAGVGDIKRSTDYNGNVVEHFYEAGREITHESYAGDPQGLTTELTIDLTTKTSTVIRKVGNAVISKSQTVRGTNAQSGGVYTIDRTFTDSSNFLETRTDSYPSGQDFGGRPFKTTNPNGTVILYEYSRTAGNLVTIIYQGVPGGANITEGTKTVSVLNAQGQMESVITTAVGTGNGVILSQMVVLSIDDFGRPLSIGHFPDGNGGYAFTTSKTYSCCGVATETDQYGVITTYAYDDLERMVKTHRLGVTIATVYDGLAENTHRYNETVAEAAVADLSGATEANLISKSVTNIAGTVAEFWSRSAADGTIIRESLTTTTYLNPESEAPASLPAGFGQRQVIQTADGFIQTTDSYMDGKTYETFGDLQPTRRYSYGVNATGEVESQSFVDGANLRETITTQSDLAGRTVRMNYMDGAFATMEYNSLGQMMKSTDPDGVTELMAYNAEGEQVITAIDLNNNGVINYGVDTVSASYTEPATLGGKFGQNNISKVWQPGDPNLTDGTIVSSSFRSSDGLYSSNQLIGVSNSSISLTELSGNGIWITTNTASDGTKQVQDYNDGRMVSMLIKDTAGATLESQTQGYDSLNRPNSSTHSRTGTSITNYFSSTVDVVKSVSDAGGRVTEYTHDVRGRLTAVDAMDTLVDENSPSGPKYDNITTTTYNPDSTVAETNGDLTYRVSRTYDYADRLISMTTYGTATATATWQYSPTRGFLLAKRDASNKGVNYTYKASGRLANRTWARGKHTRYDYDLGGRLTNIHYFTAANDDNGSNAGNDAETPSISMAYDTLGRQISQTNGLATSTFSYNSGNLQIDTETVTYNLPNQPAFTRVIDRSQDSRGRESGWELKSGATVENKVIYNYGATDGRISSISNPQLSNIPFAYTYVPNSSLIASVTSPVHSVNNVYETTRDVLASKVNKKLDMTIVSSYLYTVNNYGQRTGVNTGGTAFTGSPSWAWGYNSKGEVIKADHSADIAYSRTYLYDGIGNRISGGGLNPTNQTSYTANALNQYSAIGSINPSYDDDGNSTAYPLPVNLSANSILIWDGENRLIEAQVNGGNAVTYVYDSQSRRIAETVGSETKLTVYDTWNPISEYVIQSSQFTLHSSYIWGIDLRGSLQGAGGVGGLLSVTKTTGTYYPTFDGSGNVSEYLDSNGNTVAHYEYDPFGKETVSNGSKANNFVHRFSTKPLDPTNGLYYYGYRFYDPETGRWLSRDPIEEEGGINMYGFVYNSPFNWIDVLGEWPSPNPPIDYGYGPGVAPIETDPESPYDKAIREEKEKRDGRIEAALAFDVTLAFAANATYENAIRTAYATADSKLKDGINKLVQEGVISERQGAELYNQKRNELVKQFRGKSSPVGRYIAEAMKPTDSLPTMEDLYKRGKTDADILRKAAANVTVTDKVSKVSTLLKGCAYVHLAIATYDVVTIEKSERPRQIIRYVGGFTGAVGGTYVGGKAGGYAGRWFGVKGAAIGATGGALIGGIGGGLIGERTTMWAIDAIIYE